MLLLYSILVLICIILIKFRNYLRIYYYLLKFPGPRPLPIIGNALLFAGTYKDYGNTFFELYRKYGKIFTIWLGPLPLVIVASADIGRMLMSSTNSVDKSWFFKYIVQDYGNNVGVSSGVKWKRNNKIIRPGFSPQMLDSFLSTFNEKSKILVEQLANELNSTKPFTTFKYFTRATLDAVCENILGTQLKSQINTTSPYLTALKSENRILLDRALKIWIFPNFAFKRSSLYPQHQKNKDILYSTIETAIKTRKAQMENNSIISGEHLTLMDFLLEANETDPEFTYKDVMDEANFIILAGYATTAISLGYASLCLGYYKEIQKKVYQEIYGIFGDSDRSVELDDLAKLTYLDMVVKETLRMFPTVPHIERDALTDIKLENGLIIPKGATMAISVFHIHRDPNVWQNPEEFIPERFLTDKLPPAFLTFGSGRRTCAGMKYALMFMKVILVDMLRKYEIHTDLDIKNLSLTLDLSLSIIGGHLITITERRKIIQNMECCN